MLHLPLNQAAPILGRVLARNGLCLCPPSNAPQSRFVSSNSSDDDTHAPALAKWSGLSPKPTPAGWKSMSTASWSSGNVFADILRSVPEPPRQGHAQGSCSADAYVCTCHGNVQCFNCLHARLRMAEDEAKSNTRLSAHSAPWIQLSCVYEPEPETKMNDEALAPKKAKRTRRKLK